MVVVVVVVVCGVVAGGVDVAVDAVDAIVVVAAGAVAVAVAAAAAAVAAVAVVAVAVVAVSGAGQCSPHVLLSHQERCEQRKPLRAFLVPYRGTERLVSVLFQSAKPARGSRRGAGLSWHSLRVPALACSLRALGAVVGRDRGSPTLREQAWGLSSSPRQQTPGGGIRSTNSLWSQACVHQVNVRS